MEKQYFIVVDGNHVGPLSKEDLRMRGITPTTLVWCQGMPDWQPAMTLGELTDLFQNNNAAHTPNSPYGNPNAAYPKNPGYPQNPGYGANQYPYGQPQQMPGDQYPRPSGLQHTNWLPWAIVGTVLGLSSCLGLIFGILGIVNAKKANDFYLYGNDVQGDFANSSAKTWTIASLVLGAIGVIGNIVLLGTSPNFLSLL